MKPRKESVQMNSKRTECELWTILYMEKDKNHKKQITKIADSFLPYVDIKAFEKGIADSYTSPEKCVLCTV